MKWNSKKIKNKIKFKFTKLQVLIPRFWYPWISEGQFTGQSWLEMNRNIQLHVLKDWQKIEKGQGEAYIKTSYHTSHERRRRKWRWYKVCTYSILYSKQVYSDVDDWISCFLNSQLHLRNGAMSLYLFFWEQWSMLEWYESWKWRVRVKRVWVNVQSCNTCPAFSHVIQ